MKKIYITLLTFALTAGFAQTTIFSENIGSPAGTIAISANTFQNSTPILFSGNAEIRIITPSDTYTGASGAGCIFLGGSSPAKNIIIEGINTHDYTDLVLSFGHHKGTNVASNELNVQVSSDGATWLPLTYSRPSGPGTSVWTLITAAGTIPSTSNLRIKFENPISNAGFRIDDITLVGNIIPLNVKGNEISGLKIYPNPITNGRLFITSDNGEAKTAEIYNILGKVVLSTKVSNEAITVSNLAKGVYIIKVTGNEKTVTRKLIIE